MNQSSPRKLAKGLEIRPEKCNFTAKNRPEKCDDRLIIRPEKCDFATSDGEYSIIWGPGIY